MIVDVNEFVRPSLEIMDAVDAMEGTALNPERPRHVGAILASGSYSALDVVASRIMSIDPKEICTIKAAMERGLINEDLSDVEVIGELDKFIVPDFKRPSTLLGRRRAEARWKRPC